MKKVTKAIILLMSLAILFSLSCGDDDDDSGNKIVNPGGNNTITSTMKASITGKYSLSFSAISTIAQLTSSSHALVINGIATNSGVSLGIMLSLNVNKGTGTFPILDSPTADNDGLAAFTRTPTGEETEMFYAQSGTVTITEMGTRIKGTFSFVAQNGEGETVSITSGTFDATLSTIE